MIAVCSLLVGCSPPATVEKTKPPEAEQPKNDQEAVRRTLSNIEAYLSDLEGRLRISRAETWSQEAAAAQNALGNIRIELGSLRQGSHDVGKLESLLSDLEGELRSANPDNWSQNAPAAQQAVGNIRLELQTVRKGL